MGAPIDAPALPVDTSSAPDADTASDEQFLYFDHAASAPRRPEVLEAMGRFSSGIVGNPSGAHRASRNAKHALEDAREEVAHLTGSLPGGVVFTGGGTESCNLAVVGVAADRTRRGRPAKLAVSSIEHHAVLNACRRLDDGYLSESVETILLPVTPAGVVDVDLAVAAIDDDMDLVSIMTANNETGVIQPIPALVAAIRGRAPTAVFHTDAVAAAAWLDLGVSAAGADLVTIGAHKLGGPTGIGALCLRRDVALSPLVMGGGQELGRRSGTPDVAAAVGLATALRLSVAERIAVATDTEARRDRLAHLLTTTIDGVQLTAPSSPRLPGTCHVLIDGVDGQELVRACDHAGLCVSAAVSCSSGSTDPSHVLVAMGIDRWLALGSLRLSIGAETTDDDVERAAMIVASAVRTLRGQPPGA